MKNKKGITINCKPDQVKMYLEKMSLETEYPILFNELYRYIENRSNLDKLNLSNKNLMKKEILTIKKEADYALTSNESKFQSNQLRKIKEIVERLLKENE